ncbi:hypothetical protein ACFZAM_31165 [Streptomyces sp. NPDC008079]|uniref:putative phage holin n=1 Tax=Streptomyces sp. NPDC008079 TaxID=3364806 RepID=UPI0036E5CB23
MDWSQWINAAASALVAVCALVFVVTYALLAPWRASVAGRHVMAVTVVIGLLGAYTVAFTVWPSVAPVLRVIRVVIVLAMAGLLVQRTWMVIRAQRRR